ncbi:MAG: rRNA maturation RNase YbeY [Gemmatimonadales bacterium]|nr:rRNA maturation RNase YbeY [Candidatus Palauibacter denitrificans]
MTEPVPPAVRIDFPSGEDDWRGPSEAELQVAARAALRAGGAACEGAELSVTFLPAAAMRALNRDYHGVDDLTDVLAFGLGEDPLVGDIYISPEAAEASAGELGLDPAAEILRLVIHGVLHLLGHDHPEGEARYASPMFELQERLLARLLAEFRGRA